MASREWWWDRFADGVAVLWLALYLVTLADRAGLLTAPTGVEPALRGLFLVFIADVAVLYARSDEALPDFVRSNWFLLLTVVPWFRPLRLLRLSRALRLVRALIRSRLAGASVSKLRRLGNRLWPGREPD